MGIRIPQSDVPSSVADEAIIKEMHDGLVRATTTASSLEAEQGSGNIAKTQTKATSSGPSSPRTSSEGGLVCYFTMGDIPVQARPKRISNSWRMNLQSPKLLQQKPLSPPTPHGLKKLEKQLKHKRRKTVIDSSEDEGLSLDAKDSPKQGMMIDEIDKDKNVNFVKSRELGKSHDTAEHMMESEHDDDDITLAETLLNIKRSAAKVEAQWIANEERIPQEAKQTDEREKVINWNDPGSGDQCLVQFLMALHHDFKGLRGLVMHLDPLPSVDSVMSDLLAEDILLKSYDDMKIIGPSVLASTHHTTTSYGTQIGLTLRF
ncbi:hypothetical protein Tco_1369334 [Tanacetum coccineum]